MAEEVDDDMEEEEQGAAEEERTEEAENDEEEVARHHEVVGGSLGPGPRKGVPVPGVVAIAVAMLLIGAALGGLVGFLVTSADDDDDGDDDGASIKLDYDMAGFAGAPFSFAVNLTGADPSQATFAWSFGDGGTAGGASVQHVYSSAGTYDGNVVITIEDRTYTRTFSVTVQSMPVVPGILPEGDPPEWTLEFTGVCAGSSIDIAGMVENESAIVEVNISLEGEERSFLAVELPYLIGLAGARFDAGPFTAVGDRNYSSSVQRTLYLPRNEGNATYVVFAEGGRWLNASDMATPLMLLGEDPEAGDVVKGLREIELDPFIVHVDGPGIDAPMGFSYEDMSSIGPQNYTVMDGTSTFTFTGVPVKEMLSIAGLKRNATTVQIGALDGYTVDFLISDVLDNPESPDPFFLAYKVDGDDLPATEGPYRLITPDADTTENDGHNWFHQTWIKTISHIMVQTSGKPAPPLPWGSPVDGTLNVTWDGGYRLFTSGEVALMWDEIVNIEATMVNKMGNEFTDSYSGIPLLRLLEIAGAPAWAGNITLSSADGYSRWVDPMDVYYREAEEGNLTLVALTEGSSWLSAEKGPFRLVGSALSSAYWISQLSKIEVDVWGFTVEGTTVAIDSLLPLPKVDVTVESKGALVNYSGVDLLSYLKGLGMGPGIGSIAVSGYDYSDGAITRDGYSKTIDLRWFEGVDAPELPILAFELEGSPLGYDDKGPLRLVVPGQAGKYWIGSVTSIAYVPWTLTIKVGDAYHNMTAEQMMALSHYEGIVEGNDDGSYQNHTVAGVVIADLLLGLGADPEWTVYFKDSKGGSFQIDLGDLNVTEHEMDGSRTMRNDTGAYPLLVWSIDGEGLLPWTGLFTLVLPDDPFIGYRNWTVDMWMRGVISIEVG